LAQPKGNSATPKINPSDNKVAIVNGTVIPKHDFERAMLGVTQRLSSMGKNPEGSELEKLKSEILDNIIGGELLYQEAQKKGIKVEDSKVNQEVDSLKQKFPSTEVYTNWLKEMDLTEAAIKTDFKKRLVVQQLIEKEFSSKTNLADAEVKAFYDNNPQFFQKSDEVKASHILIRVPEGANEATKKEAKKKIEAIQAKIKSGGDFAALAKEQSDCPSKEKGGDLGFFGRGQMVPPFEKAVFALKPGETSDIVETEFGYHLIKVLDKKPASTVGFDDVKGQIKQMLSQDKLQKEIVLLVEKLKKNAKIERFIKEGNS
jgi:peptidyl-prolyl cis-trans isomerase C